eukprot:TRINITY_DN9034_c0_g1_i7.p1 TRINITY_DN9034_c0_g1~~TRINITY_DN9034_c0_g1_i7.p1  ORF type:complete len:614 (+),score=97.93 TRINITY_DN9034_c0_g1_i7:60-1901(+)
MTDIKRKRIETPARDVRRKLFNDPSVGKEDVARRQSIAPRKPPVPSRASLGPLATRTNLVAKPPPRPSDLHKLPIKSRPANKPAERQNAPPRPLSRSVVPKPRASFSRPVRPGVTAPPPKKSISDHPQFIELKEQLFQVNEQLKNSEEKCANLEATSDEMSQSLVSVRAKLSCCEQDVERLKSRVAEGTAVAAALQARIVERDSTVADLERTAVGLRDTIAARDTTVSHQAKLLQEGLHARKLLHNTIQELKGNIRVFARVRGPDALEGSPFSFPDELDGKSLQISGPPTANYMGTEASKSFAFTFDKVFAPGATQPEVFEDISQLVQSALDGYRVCVFAYGQTGSGKTYTMEGPPGCSNENGGVIPRAVHQIVTEAKCMDDQGWAFTLEATFVEIYKEEIRDLLAEGGTYDRRPGVSASGATTFESSAPKHEIKHGPDGTTITNVTTAEVTDTEGVFRLLRTAARNRQTAATNSNERSSRSHSVFTLRIHGSNRNSQQQTKGVLNLIDLAGSERLNASGAVGDRLKETQNINKSLSTLGDVIYALGAKKSHIPYRNSKLTYLLQNCLGGDSKTLMFVNLSPAESHLSETLCSLRFAAKVNACEIGTAKRKVS